MDDEIQRKLQINRQIDFGEDGESITQINQAGYQPKYRPGVTQKNILIESAQSRRTRIAREIALEIALEIKYSTRESIYNCSESHACKSCGSLIKVEINGQLFCIRCKPSPKWSVLMRNHFIAMLDKLPSLEEAEEQVIRDLNHAGEEDDE